MRRSGLLFAICGAVCATYVLVRTAVVDMIDAGLRYLFAQDPRPLFALETGDDIRPADILTFDDPHVLRHEAGMARRAAARGI